ncbi:hypothetical protein ACOL3I_01730 [Aliarcobacter butzleri]
MAKEKVSKNQKSIVDLIFIKRNEINKFIYLKEILLSKIGYREIKCNNI